MDSGFCLPHLNVQDPYYYQSKANIINFLSEQLLLFALGSASNSNCSLIKSAVTAVTLAPPGLEQLPPRSVTVRPLPLAPPDLDHLASRFVTVRPLPINCWLFTIGSRTHAIPVLLDPGPSGYSCHKALSSSTLLRKSGSGNVRSRGF